MEFDPQEITLIYDFNKQGDRESLAYAKQMAVNVSEVDISHNPLTERQLALLLDKLGVSLDEIIDKRSDIYQKKYEGKDMDETDWLSVIKHNPELMKTPIGMLGDESVICDLPNQILTLDKGQGYDQNMIT